jgi:hypothetical protein
LSGLVIVNLTVDGVISGGGGSVRVLLSGWCAGDSITVIIRTIDAVTWLRLI